MSEPVDTRVRTRTLSLKEMVQRTWGKEWTKPDVAYEFSNGRTFESTDAKQGGPYDQDQE